MIVLSIDEVEHPWFDEPCDHEIPNSPFLAVTSGKDEGNRILPRMVMEDLLLIAREKKVKVQVELSLAPLLPWPPEEVVPNQVRASVRSRDDAMRQPFR